MFRFPAGSHTADVMLGTRMEPGNDENHFCKPTDVTVLQSGDVLVTDGYVTLSNGSEGNNMYMYMLISMYMYYMYANNTWPQLKSVGHILDIAMDVCWNSLKMESTKRSGDPRANMMEVRMRVGIRCTFTIGDCFPPVLTYSCKLRLSTVII